MVYSCRDRDTRVPQNDSDDLRAVEFNSTAWKLIILISYTLKDTQEGSAAMLQGELKILSHPTIARAVANAWVQIIPWLVC